MSSNLSQTHLLCSHLILVHKILILFHMTWYQNLMHNIVIQLRNSWYSGFGPFLNYSISIFPPQGFCLYFWHSILAEVTENEDSVALRCFALWGINLFLAKNGFWRIFMFFQKKKNYAQKGAKIILDMIQGTKRVLSSQELVNSTKLNLYIFYWVRENWYPLREANAI